MFPELERIIKDLGAVESLLNEMQQQQSIRPEAFAALTQRVMALGSAVQEVATSPLVQEDSNATAFKEFTVRFKECLAKLQALKSKIDMSAKAQPAVASKTPDSSDPGMPRLYRSLLTSHSQCQCEAKAENFQDAWLPQETRCDWPDKVAPALLQARR